MWVCGRRLFRTKGKVNAEALRQNHDWNMQGGAKGPQRLEQSKQGGHSLK